MDTQQSKRGKYTRVADLPLPQYAKNQLTVLGIHTLGDLVSFGIENLRSMHVLTKLCYRKIEYCVAELYVAPSEADIALFHSLANIAYDETLESYQSYRSVITKVYPAAESICDCVFKSHGRNKLIIYSGYDRETNLCIRQFCLDFFNKLITLLESNELAHILQYDTCVNNREVICSLMNTFTTADVLGCFIPKETDQYIQLYYDMQMDTLSTRARGYMSPYSYQEMVARYEEGEISKTFVLPGKSKTLVDINNFLETFIPFVREALTLDADEVRRSMLSLQFPFLTEEELDFVLLFNSKHKHMPLFYILYLYVRSSMKNRNKILCMYWKTDDQRSVRNNIANELHLSRERVRQILEQGIDYGDEEEWINKHLVALVIDNITPYIELYTHPYHTLYSSSFRNIALYESIPFKFVVFITIVRSIQSLISSMPVDSRPRIENTYSSRYINGIDRTLLNLEKLPANISSVGDVMATLNGRKHKREEFIPYDTFLDGQVDGNCIALIREIAEQHYHWTTSEQGITIPQDSYDVTTELVSIITEQGQPMAFEDIVSAFFQRHPNHKCKNIGTLRTYLICSDEIVSLGKTNKYALAKWNLFTGTIRDKAYAILNASPEPLSLQEIYAGVIENFPNTNENSLLTTMRDNTVRFVEFQGQLFGIVGKDYDARFVLRPRGKRVRAMERIEALNNFVREHRRLPAYSGDPEEESLTIWMRNIKYQNITLTPAEQEEYDKVLSYIEEQDIPINNREYLFLERCNMLKEYVATHHRLPKQHEEPNLYTWYQVAKMHYPTSTGQRRRYFTQLLEYLEQENLV